MTSQAKSEASRRNGRLSNGPKTDAGKDISRRNALREGFTAQKLFMSSENEEQFQLFLAGMIESLQPANADEDELVNGIAMCRWRLRRIFRAEAAMLDGGDEDGAYIIKMGSLRCLGDRESKILRTMNQLEKRLGECQAKRRDDERLDATNFAPASEEVRATEVSRATAPTSRIARRTESFEPGPNLSGKRTYRHVPRIRCRPRHHCRSIPPAKMEKRTYQSRPEWCSKIRNRPTDRAWRRCGRGCRHATGTVADDDDDGRCAAAVSYRPRPNPERSKTVATSRMWRARRERAGMPTPCRHGMELPDALIRVRTPYRLHGSNNLDRRRDCREAPRP
jgi:hypothetical protein